MGIKFLDESASPAPDSGGSKIRFLDTTVGQAASKAADKLLPDVSTLRETTAKLDEITSPPVRGLKGLAVTGSNLASGNTLQGSLARGEEATKPDFAPQRLSESIASFAAEMLDPRGMAFGPGLGKLKNVKKAPGMIATEASKLGEVLTGVDERNFVKLAQEPLSVLSAKPASETGKLFAAAKKAAGVTDVEERIIALSEGARKRVYRQVLEKIDKGEKVTVAELLQAKKAGELISKTDEAAKGLISKEVVNKVNPVLKEMAPKVYEAQQAVHLSKVKESFMKLFPRTAKGDIAYLRMVGSGVSSIISPYIAVLFSPLVSGGLTAAGALAKKAALSPLGRQAFANKAVNSGFNIGGQNNNKAELDAALQRLKNAQ